MHSINAIALALLCTALLRPASDLHASADLDFHHGFELAQMQRWEEARDVFLQGFRKNPYDKRFPTELAGIYFHLGDRKQAKSYLERARQLDPSDAYINDFLGTIYYLDENLEASLKYWNLLDKPRIHEVQIDPKPEVDPVLLDHAFAVSAADKLEYDRYLSTEARIKQLGIFPRFQFELKPQPDGAFDLVLHASEKNGMGSNKVDTLVSAFRELPYRTVHADVYNVNHSAINVASTFRWDPEKQRYFASLSAPISGRPQWRYRIYGDVRKEDWDFSENPQPPGISNFHLDFQEAGIELQSVSDGRWSWKNGISISHRSFNSPDADQEQVFLLQEGYAFQYYGEASRDLLRIPQRRWKLTMLAEGQIGNLFQTSRFFSTIETGLRSEWFPKPQGQDLAMFLQLRYGKIFWDAPLDEFFELGVQQDSDLWIRAHDALHETKGTLPIGKDYFLSNWEIEKVVFRNAFLQLKLAPFIDFARVFHSGADLQSQEWLCDAGIQWRVRVLGAAVVEFTYGKDLRRGSNAFYFRIGRLW